MKRRVLSKTERFVLTSVLSTPLKRAVDLLKYMNDFTSRNPQPCSIAEKGSTTRLKISIEERGGGMVPYNYAKELNDDSLYKENNSCFVEFQATNGLILSAVMKHSSNLIRLLIIACAMSVNTALSMAISSLQLNLYFNVAFILVIVALKLYHS